MYKIGFIAIILGVFALIGHHQIGSSIDAQGFVHEPFYLIGLGWMSIFIGVTILAWRTLR